MVRTPDLLEILQDASVELIDLLESLQSEQRTG